MGGGAERAGPGPTPPALAELSSEAVDVCIRELKHKNPLHNFVQNTIFLRKQMLGQISWKVKTSFAYVPSSRSQNVSRCLKITELVSFNIASEASYVYILSGQRLIKNDWSI